eukprot:CFRG4154T1
MQLSISHMLAIVTNLLLLVNVTTAASVDPIASSQDPSDVSSEYSPVYNLLTADPERYSTDDNEVGTINWVRGSAHAPGSVEWTGMDFIGHGANTGKLVLALFNLTNAGEVRSPHWHPNANELSYIISGTARVTVTGLGYNDGESVSTVMHAARPTETFLLGPGDAFYAPIGYSHHFENVDEDEPLIGMAIFTTDDLESFDLPQVFKNIDSAVLSRTLAIPVEDIDMWYSGPRTVLDAPYSDWSGDTLKDANTNQLGLLGFSINGINKNLKDAPRMELNGKVSTNVADAETLPIMSGASIAYTELAPGAILEPYWADNADEIIYILEGENVHMGKADMSGSKSGTWDMTTGELLLNEIGITVYVENRGDKSVKLLRIFNHERPTLTTLHDSYMGLPVDVASTTLHVDREQTGLSSDE